MVKPITPSEVTDSKIASIPDVVFEAFNQLIAERWDGTEARVLEDHIVGRIRKLDTSGEIGRKIYDNHWLDVEPAYRKAGWRVEYDRPGFNESYEASFTFKKKERRVR